MRVRVVNDTEELVRCAPGTKHDSLALLQTDLDLFCEPHAELGFLFAVPRLGRSGRSAFVRIDGTTFACGFASPLEDEALRVAAISLGAAALLLAVAAGVVLYERRRRGPQRARLPARSVSEPVSGEILDETPALIATIPEAMRGIEARGFAAVLDERRIVMGVLEATRQHALSCEFVAKVLNQTAEPVLCTVTGSTRRGVVPVSPGAFRIHPRSAAAVAVVARLRFPWRLRTLHLNMENSVLCASAQADVPTPIAVRVGVAAAAAACALAVTLFGYRASMRQPLGSVQQTRSVGAVAHLVAIAPSIGALAVDPAVAVAGAPISVRYAANTDSGSVTVSDVGGIALERAPLRRQGVTMMRAPAVDIPTQYRVALDATRNGSTAHASVGLLVIPEALATAAPLPATPAGMLTAPQLLRLPAHVVSAHGFTVTLLASSQDLSLALQGADGTIVASKSVAAGATSVRLQAPRVTVDERFYLIARLRSGTAEQVLLDPVTIYAR